MSNKIFFSLLLILCGSLLISADYTRSGLAPGGYTGAEGSTCITCHGGNPINALGGSVVINNLPATYTPGITYDLSVTIKHATATRTRWGFALKAVSGGNAVGSFSENSPNAYINTADREIGHSNAPFTGPSSTYTFTNLRWTAPSNPTPSQQLINFYVSSNAVGNDGDFIYSAVQSIILNNTSVSESNLRLEKINTLRDGKKVIIRIALQKSSSLQIAVFNMNGQRVVSKTPQKFSPGNHVIEIDGTSLASGTYIVSVQNEKEKVSGKITL